MLKLLIKILGFNEDIYNTILTKIECGSFDIDEQLLKLLGQKHDTIISDESFKIFKENLIKFGFSEIEALIHSSDIDLKEQVTKISRVLVLCESLLTKNMLPGNDHSPFSCQLLYNYLNRRIDLKTYKELCEKKYTILKNLLKQYN
jgi:hypothetical protein